MYFNEETVVISVFRDVFLGLGDSFCKTGLISKEVDKEFSERDKQKIL